MSSEPALRFELVRDEAGLLALRNEWEELWADSVSATPFLNFEWVLMSWRRISLRQSDGLRIGLVRDAGRLLGALPLVRMTDFWPFRNLSGLQTSLIQYSDVLLRRHAAAEDALAALLQGLGEDRTIRRLRLDRIPEDSPLLAALSRTAITNWSLAGSARVDLSGDGEFVDTLSRTGRQQFRRMVRHMEAEGRVELRRADPETLADDLDWLLATKRRWRPKDGRLRNWLRSPLAENDIRSICLQWIGSGKVWLTTLTIGGRRAATGLAFAGRDGLYFQVITFDPAFAKYSPGRVYMILNMEAAKAAGFREVDLLGGGGEWKERLTDISVPIHRLRARLPR